ncbi:TIGR01777 family oxidoreductase [Oceanobacillus locisalsi]|uniref:TIGR01777 family oxidoreductase n=1 Tax=Oceanobacillus locisalsi TaxID=546107 RepID=A0ABW3NIS9_9BACI
MNILITGATGFLGSKLAVQLTNLNHKLYILSRSAEKKSNTSHMTFLNYETTANELPKIDAVINLAGESLFGYWTKKKKEMILTSRIRVTKYLVQLMEDMKEKPRVFISGSAVGYYGMSEDVMYTEATTQPGNDFLASVVRQWEAEASYAENMGIRTVYTRFGVLLGNDGGAFPLMSLPVKLYTGGHLSDGEQWLSWIHVQDAVKLITFCLENQNMEGAVNVTAPTPKRNKDFIKKAAQIYKRPNWLHLPAVFFYLALGEMAQLLVKGQFVYPQKALEQDFIFDFPSLDQTLSDLKNNSSK